MLRHPNSRHDERSGTEQRYPCHVCGKSYLRKGHLKRHINNECIGIAPKYVCDRCPSRYKRSEDLRRHLLKAHNVVRAGPYRSRTIDDYMDDISTAAGYYEHNRSSLSSGPGLSIANVTSSSMERPLYVNDFEAAPQFSNHNSISASKQLSQHPTHQPHQRIHFDQMLAYLPPFDGRYPCMTCGRSYLRRGHLKRHITKECIGVERQFKCKLCSMSYKRNDCLRRHMISVHYKDLTM
ncbi:zinc finger protein 816-like [Musca vetustissima]|uniref:zinc finger protein 816-like n=1 Tax=Musca vetustissima TaxID=27455 RepID=UPI002AB7E713|nr:zinc finger protein 816-like [Musca vetustissima]